MMSKLFGLYFVSLVLCIPLFSKSQINSKSVLGAWEAVKKETVEGNDGSSLTLNGKPYKPTMKVVFFDTGECQVEFKGIDKEIASYSIVDSILTIGYQSYRVEKLTEFEMVLSELSNKYVSDLFLYRRYLKRLK